MALGQNELNIFIRSGWILDCFGGDELGPLNKVEQAPAQEKILKADAERPAKLAESIKQELEAASQPKEDSAPQAISKPVLPEMPTGKLPVTQNDHELYGQPPEEMPRITPVRPIDQLRPQMADIKQPTRVVGPVDELGQTDIKEFRRLGTNPQDAAEKIIEKIDLLEEESWPMRMDGIGAWKKSPLSKLYVSIGRESMDTNRIIQEVINQRAQDGKPHVLMEEFLAINDINNKLSV